MYVGLWVEVRESSCIRKVGVCYLDIVLFAPISRRVWKHAI